ncbi:peroxide stress protein YaaA [Helicobacter sp. 11S02596-1]|uniref:peroxide stress protein YaaA n=1 Tax=Helicobacter sp. 11S02596-1 TaxID=1476194 RepID=UPI000BD08AC0|nr:peroxide stress protein YaaA [Helicobacter sp. 11S02596-1]PAF42101.1 hypothetical protein BJI48_07260 [Helicobacter sp. 11S02596-1]
MKILFSPSEGKKTSQIISDKDNFTFLDHLASSGSVLSEHIARYREILSEDDSVVARLFGVKNLNSSLEELSLCTHLGKTSRMQAIRLYSGVAFKALDFDELPLEAQDFILKNVFIFSNLFGMVRSSDILPFYKCNQNFKFRDFNLCDFYQKLSPLLDKSLEGEKILDLRAEIYAKAYPIKSPHTRIEFLKNGKKVSHYAKHYRGVYLRELSLCPDSALEAIESEDLEFLGHKMLGNATILTYAVH